MQSVPPRAAFALLLTVLATVGVAEAGVSAFWRPRGTSASGNGVSQTPSPKMVFDASLAVAGNGRPVVAYTEYLNAVAEQGAITVKRWTGSAWQTLSGAGGIGQGYQPQVRISSTGAIYVAWLTDDDDGNTEIRLRVRTTTTFGPLGGSDSPGGISGANPGITGPFSLALDGSGNPIVAFIAAAQTGADPALIDGTAQIYVRRWTGSVWEFVGSDFTGGGASNALSFASGADTIVHIADTPSLAIDSNGDPVVAFTYFTTVNNVPAANTDIYVTRWNGGEWTAVGPAVPSSDTPAGKGQAGGVSDSGTGSFNPSLAPDAAGRLALAWEEDTPTGATYIWLRVWNGVDTWEELAGSATGSGFTEAETLNTLPQIAVDPDGNPIVAWQAQADLAAPTQVFVLRWNGAGAWDEMPLASDSASNAGISDAALDAMAPALALTPPGGTAKAGVPTVAWLDRRNTGTFQIFLRQFFTGDTVPLRVTVIGDGTVTSNPIGVECAAGTCVTRFPKGTVVTLVPQERADTAFRAWAGACTGGRACTVSLTVPRSVNATFVAGATLTVEVVGEGGRVSSGPAGIANCMDSCSAKFAQGTTVTLTAAVNAGGIFTGWGDFCAPRGTNTTCAVPLDANTSVTATFDLRRHSLAVVSRPGGGVASLPPLPNGTIDCGNGSSACTGILDYGTPVALQATPNEGFTFVNWTGVSCAGGATNTTCAFALRANVTVRPTYRARTVVTVVKDGTGAGTVTGPGINCGADCSAAAFDGRAVTLRAVATAGSSFLGFANACVSAGPTCTFVPAGNNRTVGASFSIQSRWLNVTVAGNGSVSGSGFSCDPGAMPCTQAFDYGTILPLTPTPAAGHRFTGWSMGCIGTNPGNCRPLMTVNRSVKATFRPIFGLEVSKTGNSNSGAITSSPGGINCGVTTTDCSQTYLGGTLVTLTRSAPVTGTVFRWLGDCAFRGTNASCALPMNANASVGAEYQRRPLRLTVNRIGPLLGHVSRVGGALDCGAGCVEVIDYGTPVTLLATPSLHPASQFVSWTGCTPATNLSCTFRLTANRTVTATFRPRVASITLQTLSAGPLAVGSTRQITALATFTDATVQDVTAQSTWSSNASTIATVSASGFVTARGVLGRARVVARFRGVTSDPFVVEVDRLVAEADVVAPRPRAIVVECSPYGESAVDASLLACLPSGRRFEVHCRATGRFAGAPDADVDITDQVTWASTSATIARPTGLFALSGPVRQSFRMNAAGIARLYARMGSHTSLTTGTLATDAWVVQGTPQQLPQTPTDPLQIQPATPSVQVGGDPVQLRAIATLTGTGACANPPQRDFSLLVDWASDDETVAEVNFFGAVTGVAQGDTGISATYGIMEPVTVPIVVHP